MEDAPPTLGNIFNSSKSENVKNCVFCQGFYGTCTTYIPTCMYLRVCSVAKTIDTVKGGGGCEWVSERFSLSKGGMCR